MQEVHRLVLFPDEIIMVADRILVFFFFFIIKDVKAAETNASELAKAIAGKV